MSHQIFLIFPYQLYETSSQFLHTLLPWTPKVFNFHRPLYLSWLPKWSIILKIICQLHSGSRARKSWLICYVLGHKRKEFHDEIINLRMCQLESRILLQGFPNDANSCMRSGLDWRQFTWRRINVSNNMMGESASLVSYLNEGHWQI